MPLLASFLEVGGLSSTGCGTLIFTFRGQSSASSRTYASVSNRGQMKLLGPDKAIQMKSIRDISLNREKTCPMQDP